VDLTFFFSSRRRHTRSDRDWSSDVCSSDLARMPAGRVPEYEDIIARLRGGPVLVNQTITLLERGLATGVTPPQITLRDVPAQARSEERRVGKEWRWRGAAWS